jgi:hypothetical protein
MAKKAVSELEIRLREYAKAFDDFKLLVRDGCDLDELSTLLEINFLAERDTWERLVGMNLRGLETALKEIKACAGLVERLNCTEFVHRLSIEHRDPALVRIQESPTLPEQLRSYVAAIDHRRKAFGPRRNLRRHAWKARIVAIVIEDTQKPHDAQVASVIAAILNDSEYSPKAHQAWRLKYSALIERVRAQLKEQRKKRQRSIGNDAP